MSELVVARSRPRDRTRTNFLNFQNSNYLHSREHPLRRWRVELDHRQHDVQQSDRRLHLPGREPRVARDVLPVRRHLGGRSAYTSFGSEPFTPNNELRYKTFQLQDNFTKFANKHSLTFGVSLRALRVRERVLPGSQSVYVYNSLDDFYTDANDYLANPNRTTSPVTLRRFQVRYMQHPRR